MFDNRYLTLLFQLGPTSNHVFRQEFSSMSSLDQSESRSLSANAFESEERRTSPSMPRLPPPTPAPGGQTTPSFMSTPRSLPPPASNDPSQSPMQSNAQRSSKSPSDDVSISSTLRLPSITRHGYLVEDGSRAQLPLVPGSPGSESQLPSASNADAGTVPSTATAQR